MHLARDDSDRQATARRGHANGWALSVCVELAHIAAHGSGTRGGFSRAQ